MCVEGVCSTVERRTARAFEVIYMPETLRRTTLGNLISGCAVNLERCLTLRSLIGGHLIQGHVDATALVTNVSPDGGATIYEFAPPRRLMRYVVEKGSVAIDGISLTVVHAGRSRFTISLLERTLSHTTMGGKRHGDRVNVEVDVMAKYAERLLAR